MPRNSGGTYSLPAGNPVSSGSPISSTWANDTLNDLKAEMTDSLSRSGKGGMSAPMTLVAGTSAVPGLGWVDDPDSGFHYVGSGNFRLVVNGVELLDYSSNRARLSGTAPAFQLRETDGAANNKLWNILASGEDLKFQALLDDNTPTDFMTVTRTGGTVDSIALVATTITLNGSAPMLPADNITFSGTIQFTGPAAAFTNAPTVAGTSVRNTDILNAGTLGVARGGTGIASYTANNYIRASGAATLEQRTPAQVLSDIGGVGTASPTFTGTATIPTAAITTIELGHASDTTIARIAAGRVSVEGVEIGFRSIPRSTTSGTATSADNGKCIALSADITIPASTFSAGDAVSLYNDSASAVTITQGAGLTLRQSGTTSTGNRTLAARGVATIWFNSATEAVISGSIS